MYKLISKDASKIQIGLTGQLHNYFWARKNLLVSKLSDKNCWPGFDVQDRPKDHQIQPNTASKNILRNNCQIIHVQGIID